MAGLAELEQWEALIYQLETTDPVVGGQDGISNRQARQLANRTLYLLRKLLEGDLSYVVDAGVANAYVTTYSPAITSLKDGMVLRFKATNANTGSSTLAVNGLTARQIVGGAHAALQGGEIVAGGVCAVQWSAVLNAFILQENSGGARQVADATKTKHATTLNQFGSAISQNGYQKLPSGLIIQWQLVNHSSAGTQAFSFPIAFPTNPLFVIATDQTAASPALTVGVASLGLATFSVTVTDSAGAAATGGAVMVLSIGS